MKNETKLIIVLCVVGLFLAISWSLFLNETQLKTEWKNKAEDTLIAYKEMEAENFLLKDMLAEVKISCEEIETRCDKINEVNTVCMNYASISNDFITNVFIPIYENRLCYLSIGNKYLNEVEVFTDEVIDFTKQFNSLAEVN